MIAALAEPYWLARRDVRVSASIGISFARPPDIKPTMLLEQADSALYRAKREGRNTFRVAGLPSADRTPAALKAIAERMRCEEAISGDRRSRNALG